MRVREVRRDGVCEPEDRGGVGRASRVGDMVGEAGRMGEGPRVRVRGTERCERKRYAVMRSVVRSVIGYLLSVVGFFDSYILRTWYYQYNGSSSRIARGADRSIYAHGPPRAVTQL